MATEQTQTSFRAAIGHTHPLYDLYRAIWVALAHCAEGTGGFLDGTYLVAHPREWKDHELDFPQQPNKKLLERRRLARYENLADLALRAKRSGLFREPPIRRCISPDGKVVETHPFLDWTTNVDGAGTSLTEWMRATFIPALIYGHTFAVMDRAGDSGPTQADAPPLLLRGYTPLDVPDWLTTETKHLGAIKVVEPIPRASLTDAPAAEAAYKVTEIDAAQARTYRSDAKADATSVQHGFGALPVVQIFAHRRGTLTLIGLSALSDPKLYIDLFNLTSEIRELLRKQTFSVLNIPLGVNKDGGPAMSIADAQTLIGQTNGTANVMFSGEPAQFIGGDTTNVTVYQAERQALIRVIYKLCCLPWDDESRDAESAEAKRLKRQDYTTALSGYADELTQAEMAIAQLWFRGTYGADAWEAEWDKAGVQVQYPTAFDDPDPAMLLELSQAALALPIGESQTFRVELGTKMVPVFLPDASPDVQGTIRKELEAAPTPQEQREEQMEAMTARLAAAPKKGPPKAAA